MKHLLPLLSGLLGPLLHAQHQTASFTNPHVDGAVPYSVEISELTLGPGPVPNLHSFAAAQWEGKWVMLAGRTNGLHGLTGMNAFDPAYDNRDVWVIDPSTGESWSKSLETSPASGLGSDAVDSLSSVNTQFYQDGDTLLVIGGYGYQRSAATHVTYGRLTAVDLPGLVSWVISPAGAETTRAADHIRQLVDSYFQVTGGGLEKIGSEFQLVFGQDYEGRYRPMFNGVYTRQVRRFQVVLNNGLPSVPSGSKIATAPDDAFRRRDLNVVPVLERTGKNSFEEKVLVLSGVFTPATGVWTVPVVVSAGGSVVMADPAAADTLRQGFQVYHCAKASLFHRVTNESHTLLFGGLTVLERDSATGGFTRDDNVPFTNQCSLVVRNADGLVRQYWLTTRFPRILSSGKELLFGTNAEFFPAAGVAQLSHKILDLAFIDAPTLIGHVFGGIVADAGNGGNTGASGRVFSVTLVPHAMDAGLSIAGGMEMELRWDSAPGHHDLLEESGNLEAWSEMTVPLSGINSWPLSPTEPRRFHRRLTATPTVP